MIKVLIIEDETEARQALVKLLHYINPDINIVGETTSITESVRFLNNNNIDLALVDVELKDGNSFEVFKQLKTVDFKVIFTTAFSRYAIKAFKVNALDYLLKPIDPEELREAVEKAMAQVYTDNTFKKLLEVSEEKEAQKIVLKTTQERHVIKIADIVRVEAEGAYTNFVTTTKSILVSKNLKHYETFFADYNFLRPHNSHLINASHVSKIKPTILIMSNTDEVPISTRKRSEIHKALLSA